MFLGMTFFLVSMISLTTLDTSAAMTEEARVLHTISYKNIPGHADMPMTELAILDSVMLWNAANKDVQFVIVEYDADVKIIWRDYMSDFTLGEHRATLNDDGVLDKHRILIRLGMDDCNSDYQLFSYDILKHTIMHEMGHYLGLEHTDDWNHLMYSHELFGVFDDLGLVIPYSNVHKFLYMIF